MAEGERRHFYPNGAFYNPVIHGNQGDVNQFSYYPTTPSYHNNTHRASFPGTAPRVLVGEGIDLSRFDAAVSESQIENVPVHSLVKPEHDQVWAPPAARFQNQMRLRPQPAPGWLGGHQGRQGAMSDPTPHHDLPGDMSSENDISEAGDSRYHSDVPFAVDGPSLLNQSSLSNPTSVREYIDTRLTHNFNISGGASQHFPHPPAPQSVVSDSRLHMQPKDTRKGRSGKTTLLACPKCGRQPKNQSDAKKHSLTHTKPFRCHEPTCSRKDGFATENDLQRHRKSVHKATPTVGSSVGFVCAACPPPDNGKPPKFWPRRDNFKAHVKRKHSNYDENSLIQRSIQNVRPDDVKTAPSTGRSSYPESLANSTDYRRSGMSAAPNSTDLARRLSHADEFTTWPPNSTSDFPRTEASLLGGMGHATMTDQSMLGVSELPAMTDSTDAGGLSILSDAAFEQGLTSFMETPPPDPQRVKRRRFEDTGNYRGSEHNLHISDLGAGSNMGAGTSERHSAVNTSASQGSHVCSHCGKVSARECDFKKHMKRHTRPYGCTFPRCSKRFGSRNDWKRHESSQHYLSELWKCSRQNADGTMCTHPPFPRLDHLKKHLATRHNVTNIKDINAECAKFRLGQNANDHFWCGFCKKLIKQDEANPYAYAARFQHIGDHFDKDHYNIDAWVCIEKHAPKGQIPSQEDGVLHVYESDEEKEGTSKVIAPPTSIPAGFDEPVDFMRTRREGRNSTAQHYGCLGNAEGFREPGAMKRRRSPGNF